MTRLVEDPVLKQRLALEPIEDGQAVRVEMWVDPGGGVPPHMHPRMEETFEVLSGELSLLDGREWAAPKAGEAGGRWRRTSPGGGGVCRPARGPPSRKTAGSSPTRSARRARRRAWRSS